MTNQENTTQPKPVISTRWRTSQRLAVVLTAGAVGTLGAVACGGSSNEPKNSGAEVDLTKRPVSSASAGPADSGYKPATVGGGATISVVPKNAPAVLTAMPPGQSSCYTWDEREACFAIEDSRIYQKIGGRFQPTEGPFYVQTVSNAPISCCYTGHYNYPVKGRPLMVVSQMRVADLQSIKGWSDA